MKIQKPNFLSNENGSLSVETVLIFPILVWVVLTTFVAWDAFKTINVNQKATFTIADLLSRETREIDADYITTMHELHDFLGGAKGDNALRVSVVTLNEDPDTLVQTMELVWSTGIGGVSGYEDLTKIEDRIPDMAAGDQLILVESEQGWSPVFAVGMTPYRFSDIAITRPRFAPQLVWDTSGGSTPATITVGS